MILLATKADNQALAMPIINALKELDIDFNIYCKNDNIGLEKYTAVINLYCNILQDINKDYIKLINFISDDHKIYDQKILTTALYNVFTSEKCLKDVMARGHQVDYSRDVIITDDVTRFLSMLLIKREAA